MEYILYIGRDKEDLSQFCPGSLVCMSLVEKLQSKVQVQDCHILQQSRQLPSWLNGTPILVERNNAVPLRGTTAVRTLQELLKEQRESSHATAQQTAHMQKPQGAMQRMQPQATRQPGAKESLQEHRAEMQQQMQQQQRQLQNDESEEDEPLDTMANGQNAQLRDDKVTENDLQRYMEQRKQSPASASPPQQHSV